MDFLKKGFSQFAATVGELAGEGRAATLDALGGHRSHPSGASGSSGQLSSTPSEPPPPLNPASLPEVRFDERNPDEAHVLFLWTVFAGAPADSPMQEEALESFVDGFVVGPLPTSLYCS